jgi:hypothetical protein
VSVGTPVDARGLPAFLGIGSPQSGTTWLDRNLRRHPGLFLPTPKETNFFDRHFERGIDWYREQFREAGRRTIGEVTPSYGALTPQRIRLIHDWLPRVRLVYLLRNPIDRAWSRARRRYARDHDGGTEGLGLEELRAYEANQSIAPGAYAPGVMKGDHARILENWLREFEPERLLVLRFEDIQRRPRALLTDVFTHLGVAVPADWSGFPVERRINPNPPSAMPPDCQRFLEDRYRDGIAALRTRFRFDTAAWEAPGLTALPEGRDS